MSYPSGASVLAPAKVNLTLAIGRRRADGFHEIETIFQSVDLCDEVTVEPAEEGFSTEVVGAEVGPDDQNLATLAARAYAGAGGPIRGARIRLAKRIPAGAGLGGGSSDAAAVIRCLMALVGDVDLERARRIAAGLGSDVPFFLGDSTLARGGGRGERLEPLAPLPVADLVVAVPEARQSTAEAYAALGRTTEVAPLGPAPEPRSWDDVAHRATNDFEPVVSASVPEVGRSLDALRASGADLVLMSGSGSASFGRFPDRGTAERVAGELTEALGWPCLAVRTLREMPEVAVR